MSAQKFDVIVIGAGPAGGQTARSLSKRGCKVLLVEKSESFADNDFSSAGMTLAPLKEFNLPDSIIGSYWNHLEIQCTKNSYLWESEKPQGVVLNFKKLRQFLADECTQNGGEVLLGHKYVKKEVKNNFVLVDLLDVKTSDVKTFETKIVVDATGPLRKVMFDEKEVQPKMILGSGTEYLIEVDKKTYDNYRNKLVFFLGHKWAIKGYSWIFPMEDKLLKVGAGKTHLKSVDQEKTNQTTKKITEKIIEEYIQPKEYKILDVHGGILRYSPGLKDIFYKDKVVGVGDAVSAINPRGGEGIRYAMQSAELACEYIYQYLSTGKENFNLYRKKWRRRKLLKWRLSEVSGRRMYSRYSDEQVENRVRFFHKKFSADQMVESLFNFKYNAILSRVFQFLYLKVLYKMKGEKF